MTRRGMNTDFLTPEELEQYGVQDAARRNILVHKTCVILDFAHIEFGSNVRIDPYCVITCKQLKLGDYIHIGSGCTLSGDARIRIGDFGGISNHSLIFTSSDDYSGRSLTNPTVPVKFTNVHTDEVSVGRHAILGARTIVLPGSNIPEGASTGAGTLVKGSLDPWMIYAGSPAVAIKPRVKDCLSLEAELRASQIVQSSLE